MHKEEDGMTKKLKPGEDKIMVEQIERKTPLISAHISDLATFSECNMKIK
jgi:hypothetical protein